MSEQIGDNVILLEDRVRRLREELAITSYQAARKDLEELREALRQLYVLVALAEASDASFTRAHEIHLVLDRLTDTLAEIKNELRM